MGHREEEGKKGILGYQLPLPEVSLPSELGEDSLASHPAHTPMLRPKAPDTHLL